MATRCIIEFQDSDIVVYKHWDGYPAATFQFLVDFNKAFSKMRGDDTGYKIAQLLRFSSKYAEKYNLDPSEFTGWGVFEKGKISGEEYTYRLMHNGSVKIYASGSDKALTQIQVSDLIKERA